MNSESLPQYIYGVIPFPAEGVVSRNGITIVGYEDIAAVVSRSEPVDIAKMRKDALAKLLLAHQKVIEQVMQSAANVIPFRLGTYARSESETMEILAKGQELIRRIFGEINGRIEMDVVATWADFASVLKEIGEEDEIKKGKAALAASPRGVNVDDQMKIGLMIKQALDLRRNEISRRIFERLSPESRAHSKHENMDDQMLMNGAFLIETVRRPEFERVLDELNTRFAGKINFRCVGPLAPYSFYTLELKTIRWEDVDWARRIIGLGDMATEEEIKTAFLNSVKAAHPDHCGQGVSAEAAFKEIGSARRILLEYTETCRQSAAAGAIVFNEENVRQNSLLVKVRNGS